MKNIRNRESGTLGASSNNYRGADNSNGYQFDGEDDEMR